MASLSHHSSLKLSAVKFKSFNPVEVEVTTFPLANVLNSHDVHSKGQDKEGWVFITRRSGKKKNPSKLRQTPLRYKMVRMLVSKSLY